MILPDAFVSCKNRHLFYSGMNGMFRIIKLEA